MSATASPPDAAAPKPRRGWVLELEDLALFAYLAFGERLVMRGATRVTGNVNPLGPLGGTHGRMAALASFVAALGAALCLATRTSGDGTGGAASRDGFEDYARIVSMVLVGMLIMAGQMALGHDPSLGWFFGALGLLSLTYLLYGHLPTAPGVVRRFLMTPAILLGTTAFMDFSQRLLPARAQLAVLWRPHASGHDAQALIVELLLGAIGVYYILFVVAPRKAAGAGGSPLWWGARFIVFLGGMWLNLNLSL
jgi:hypothetical protein